MRIIDLHCYPNTQKWIDCQGPYVQALAEYWGRDWQAKYGHPATDRQVGPR